MGARNRGQMSCPSGGGVRPPTWARCPCLWRSVRDAVQRQARSVCSRRWPGGLCPMARSESATRHMAHKGVSTAPCGRLLGFTRDLTFWPASKVAGRSKLHHTGHRCRTSAVRLSLARKFASLSRGGLCQQATTARPLDHHFELEQPVRSDQGFLLSQCPQSRRALGQGADTRTVTREFVAST